MKWCIAQHRPRIGQKYWQVYVDAPQIEVVVANDVDMTAQRLDDDDDDDVDSLYVTKRDPLHLDTNAGRRNPLECRKFIEKG